MTRRLTFLFALATGAAVANLYWAQPLLDFIADDLHAPTGSAAATVLWSAGGWQAVATAGIAISCFALAVWAAGSRGPLKAA